MDTLKASKMLQRWVEQGVLLKDDPGGKRNTVYLKPTLAQPALDWDGSLSSDPENESGQSQQTLTKQRIAYIFIIRPGGSGRLAGLLGI